MADKIFGLDFTNEATPTSTMTISVYNGSTLVDVALSDLYKALPAAAIQTLLDYISTTQGVILYYNGTDWAVLAPGTSGQVLKTQGAAANPVWGLPGDLSITSQAQGDILYFNGTIWTRLAAGTSGHFLKTNGAGANPAWAAASGGTTLSNSNISPTTANVTAAVNTRYFADISGLTAVRNFILPSGTVGDEIELFIKVGDSAYTLNVIGDTGVSINGGATATLWSPMMITGESVRLILDTTTNWSVRIDKRIACLASQRASAAQTAIVSGTPTKLTMGTSVVDNSSLNDTANNRIIIRRAGSYNVRLKVPWALNANADVAAHAMIYKGGSSLSTLFLPNSANEPITPMNLDTVTLAVGDILEAYGTQYSGINRDTYYSAAQAAYVSLTVEEKL